MNLPKIIFLASLLAFTFGCEKENCTGPTWTYELFSDKEITITQDTFSGTPLTLYEIIDGEKTVATYTFGAKECEEIYDDEYAEHLSLQFDESLEAFEFKDEDILTTNCFYHQSGAWVRHNRYRIQKGTITGKKLNGNQWDIQVNVETTPIDSLDIARQVLIDGVFRK